MKKETEITPAFTIKQSGEVQFEMMLEGLALANTDKFLFVYPEAKESSDWVGKIYHMSYVTILDTKAEWLLIESGDVKGYVKAANILTGRDALEEVKEILTEMCPTEDIFALTKGEVFENLTVGESREAEAIRLAEEEAARIAAEKAAEEARRAAERAEEIKKGNAVIAYAKQFLGNPYVYGGTSLTRGTDCSGFVRGVYAHFGYSLPRTSYSQRGVGEKVSYSEMQPGDIVCYSGHVAIYAGDGKIVHAANERKGITISDVNYARIITIRRVL